MNKFNKRLAGYLNDDFLLKVADEMAKPQSYRAAANKLQISVYAMKRLNDYYKSTNGVCNEC